MNVGHSKLEAYGQRVVVHVDDSDQKVGSIFVPNKKPLKGFVHSVGTALKDAVKVGSVVHYSPFGGLEIEHNGQKFIVIHSDDILATES